VDEHGKVTRLKENYLSLTGYRLPQEAEMEYACRAGAVTGRHYGESEELLGEYAWYASNSHNRSWPVGTKKPNDFGFFDVHGNVYCWCQDEYRPRAQGAGSKAIEDKEGALEIDTQKPRVLRGGSFLFLPSYVRSASRLLYAPAGNFNGYGFRPARTFPVE
jgi:formylglycine-generating enzyme required for sulfatase activity